MIDYTIAQHWSVVVRAIAMTESNESETGLGDGGQAYGLLQQHPAFFIHYYKDVGLHDTWTDAYIKACAAYLSYAVPRLTLAGAIQAYNLGVAAYKNGNRNLPYWDRFVQNYNKIGGSVDEAPIGGAVRRTFGRVLRRYWDVAPIS